MLMSPVATRSLRLSQSYAMARLGVAGKMDFFILGNTAWATTHLQTLCITSLSS